MARNSYGGYSDGGEAGDAVDTGDAGGLAARLRQVALEAVGHRPSADLFYFCIYFIFSDFSRHADGERRGAGSESEGVASERSR